jgi:hypothetical protein
MYQILICKIGGFFYSMAKFHIYPVGFSLWLIEDWGCKYVFYVHNFFILQDFASWTLKLRTRFGVLVW